MVRNEFVEQIRSGTVPGGMWLLHGTDRYSIRKAVAACRNLPDEAARELNLAELEAPALPDLWAAVDALPFFSERRVVVVEKLDLDSMRAVSEHKERIPDTTLLLIVQYAKAKKEWTELFDAKRVVEFAAYNEAELSAFFDRCAGENGLSIAAPAKQEFLKRTGPDLAAVENYIKLLSNVRIDKKPVTLDQVEAYIPPVVEEKSWNMMDAFLAGDIRGGISMFEKMYGDEPGPGIVFMTLGYMVKRCGQMIEAKRMLAARKTEAEVIATLGLKAGYGANNLIRSAKNHSHDRLARIHRALCRFDSDLRRGNMSDHDAFFLALCRAFIDETEAGADE